MFNIKIDTTEKIYTQSEKREIINAINSSYEEIMEAYEDGKTEISLITENKVILLELYPNNKIIVKDAVNILI